MDQLLVELIGKPKLIVSGKIITLIVENFSMLEDQARFLKATLAIPTEKQLPLEKVQKTLIQIGPLQQELKCQLDKANWKIIQLDQQLLVRDKKDICDILASDISGIGQRSLIFINDASKLQLLLEKKMLREFLQLIDRWKRHDNHFVIVLYQHYQIDSSESFIFDLEYISDSRVRTKSFRNCYLQSIWYQPIPSIKTLLPPKVESSYYTCKIGKSYWSTDLLCFYDRVKVTKDFNPNLDIATNDSYSSAETSEPSKSRLTDKDNFESALQKIGLDDEDEERTLKTSTLPYMQAQNPEKSRIFYYPDKDDDVDEDDPDDDLGI